MTLWNSTKGKKGFKPFQQNGNPGKIVHRKKKQTGSKVKIMSHLVTDTSVTITIIMVIITGRMNISKILLLFWFIPNLKNLVLRDLKIYYIYCVIRRDDCTPGECG